MRELGYGCAFVVVILIVSGVLLSIWFNAQDAQAAPQPTPQAAQSTPEPSQEKPTQEPKTTPNAEATAAAVAQAASVQTQMHAAQIALEAANRNYDAAKVEADAAIKAAQIAADAQGRTDSAMIRLAEVEGDYAIRLAELQLEIVQAQTELMRAETELHRQERANNEFILQVVMVVSIVVIIVTAAIVAIRGRFRREQVDDEYDEDEQEEDLSWLPRFPAGVRLELFTEHIPAPALVAIARGVRAGEPFTHNHWVRGENVLSEGKFMTLQRLMVPAELAAWNNERNHRLGCTPTAKGVLFFKEISYPTPSPPRADVQNPPVQPRTDTIRHDSDPLPAGQGWSKTT